MTEQAAASLWHEHGGSLPESVTRLTTGSANYVFLVRDRGERFILRACPPEQKREIAARLWSMQRRVAALTAAGYGYLSSLDDPNRKSRWKDVVAAHLARSRSWIRSCAVFEERFVDEAEALLPRFDAYFETVEPRAFFDDATTKNLLIHQGRFEGLVDLDWLCFGDRLYNLALIRMALLELGADTDYVGYLVEEEGVDGFRKSVLSFYTLVFCVDFMGGVGMPFNKPAPPVVTEAQKTALTGLFRQLRAEIS